MTAKGKIFILACGLLALVLCALLASAVVQNGDGDRSVSSDDPVIPGNPAGQINAVGYDDDGTTIQMKKGEKFTARFLEYNNGTWTLQDTVAAKLTGDVVMESYPAQHVMTFEAVKSGVLIFDFRETPGNASARSVSVNILVN